MKNKHFFSNLLFCAHFQNIAKKLSKYLCHNKYYPRPSKHKNFLREKCRLLVERKMSSSLKMSNFSLFLYRRHFLFLIPLSEAFSSLKLFNHNKKYFQSLISLYSSMTIFKLFPGHLRSHKKFKLDRFSRFYFY